VEHFRLSLHDPLAGNNTLFANSFLSGEKSGIQPLFVIPFFYCPSIGRTLGALCAADEHSEEKIVFTRRGVS
jgi:hypothetical protein